MMGPGKIFLAFLLAAWTVFTSGCSRPAPDSEPRAVLTAYIEAAIEGRHEDAQQYLAAKAGEIRKAKTEGGDSFEERLVRRALAAQVSFEIASMEISGTSARSEVKMTSPDFRVISRDISARLEAANFPEGGMEAIEYTSEMVNSLLRQYRAKGIPVVRERRTYELLREGDAWKVSTPWGELHPEGPVSG